MSYSGMPFVGLAFKVFKRICKNLVKFAEQIKRRVFYAPMSPSSPHPFPPSPTATAVRDCRHRVVYER